MEPSNRRTFLAAIGAVAGAIAAVVVALPGAAYVLDPLWRRRRSSRDFVRVASLADVPRDLPASFPVISDVVDAWTRTPRQRLGTVWLRRSADDRVEALQAECPHLGCSVGFDRERSRFACPCHESAFGLDGRVQSGPAPRALDRLDARVRGDFVEVRFVRYRPQTRERVEVG